MTSPRASTRHPERLASPRALLALTRALALLDEVFWSQWDERYYSFDKNRDGTCLAQMRNGEGDLWYLRFLPNGAAVLRGFDHESAMNPYRGGEDRPWPGLFEGMPRSLVPWKSAVDVEPSEVTFVMWHTAPGPWRTGPVAFPPGKDPDGSEWLLEQMDGAPASYIRLVEARLERAVDHDAVRAVYGGALDTPTILRLNPNADAASVLRSARTMAFPVQNLGRVIRAREGASRAGTQRRGTSTSASTPGLKWRALDVTRHEHAAKSPATKRKR